MPSERTDETLLVRYLLGNLAEEEQIRVEDRAFADAGFMGALEAAEADLIDAYVRGELTLPERLAFENRFLTSSGRRSKVEFARALAQVSTQAKAAESARHGWKLPLRLLPGWTPPLQVAAASGVVLVAGAAVWLTVENWTLRSRIGGLEARLHGTEQVSTAPSGTPQSAPAASLVFMPGLSRAETRLETLELGSSTGIAHIEIRIEPRDNYTRFRVELRRRSGEDVLTQSNLMPRGNQGRSSVSFDVPASALQAGSYELALKGMTAGNRVEDVGYYYFHVLRKD